MNIKALRSILNVNEASGSLYSSEIKQLVHKHLKLSFL